jgi:hypothetical protein
VTTQVFRNGQLGFELAERPSLRLSRRDSRKPLCPCVTNRSSRVFPLQFQLGHTNRLPCGGESSQLVDRRLITIVRHELKAMTTRYTEIDHDI